MSQAWRLEDRQKLVVGPRDRGNYWAQEGERLAREGGGTRLQMS